MPEIIATHAKGSLKGRKPLKRVTKKYKQKTKKKVSEDLESRKNGEYHGGNNHNTSKKV